MKTIHIGSFACLSSASNIAKLNRLFRRQTALMPHEVANDTGCDIDEVMAALMVLLAQSIVEGRLLVYHANNCIDPPAPILVRNLFDGPPPLPITCDICNREIEHEDALSYDFLFKLRDEVEFVQ